MVKSDYIEKPAHPEAYRVRPACLDDAEAVVALMDKINRIKNYPSGGGIEELRAGWQKPGFNMEDSSLLIENEKGDILAYAALWDLSTTPVHPWCSWSLHDSYY